MKYLKCEKCGFYNDANSERLVFCKNCGEKLNNSYFEWQKNQYDKSFQRFSTMNCVTEKPIEKVKNVNVKNLVENFIIKRNWQIFNIVIVSILLLIRLSVIGIVFVLYGFMLTLVITTLHIIATNRSFTNLPKLKESEITALFISFVLYIVFILFQFEATDKDGFMVIEGFIRKFSQDFEFLHFETFSIFTTLISSISLIVIDIFILIKLRNIKQRGE